VLSVARRIEVVLVNPAAVYGPGPVGSASLEESLFRPLVRGRLPALPPGGMGVVFTEGVAAGHLLGGRSRAYRASATSSCDRHVSMRELAGAVVRIAGAAGCRARCAPAWPMVWRSAGEALSSMVRRPPAAGPAASSTSCAGTLPQNSSKAQAELGWEPTSLDDGLRRTLEGMGLA